MKVGKVLVVLVLLPVAGYAAAKSYVHYKTSAAVERLVTQAAIFGTIKYRGISSTLWSGVIQVDGIELRPHVVSDTVSIRSLALRTGSFMGLLDLASRSRDGKPPESLSVRLEGASVAADGPLLRMGDDFINTVAAASGTPQTSPHCGDRPVNGLAVINELGYRTLALDGEVGFSADKDSGRVTVQADFEVQDMVRITTRTVLAGITGNAPFSAPPVFKEFEMTYKDLSYKDRLMRLCAQAAGTTDAEYIQAEVDNGMFRQLGIVPGPGLREAYRNFLTTPNGEWRVRVQPSEGFDMNTVGLFRPEDVLQQLNATVAVNDKLVADLSFTFDKRVIARAKPNAPTDKSTRPKHAAVPPSTSSILPRDADLYRTVDVDNLERYIDRYVRLHEAGREPREGVLTQIRGDVATVERRYPTGKVAVKVRLTRVVRAEIRF